MTSDQLIHIKHIYWVLLGKESSPRDGQYWSYLLEMTIPVSHRYSPAPVLSKKGVVSSWIAEQKGNSSVGMVKTLHLLTQKLPSHRLLIAPDTFSLSFNPLLVLFFSSMS